MIAYAKTGLLRLAPYHVTAGIYSEASHRPKVLSAGFADQGHLGYYSASSRRIRCQVKSENLRREVKVKDKSTKKLLKKRSKLLKNLSKDLSSMIQIGFGLDCSEPYEHEMAISEAAETLLIRLQKLRTEGCEDSSSSSSESSDSECEGFLNTNRRKNNAIIQHVTSESNPVVIPDSINSLSTPWIDERASAGLGMPARKIEVCMGGKCKKSGAQAILEELRNAVGVEGAVSGCKCMGKCKAGPNVRVSSIVEGSPDNA